MSKTINKNNTLKKGTVMGMVEVKPFIMKGLNYTINHGIATGKSKDTNVITVDDLLVIIKGTYPSINWNNTSLEIKFKSITLSIGNSLPNGITTSFDVSYKLHDRFTSVKLPWIKGMAPIRTEHPLIIQLAFDWYDSEQVLSYPVIQDPSYLVANQRINVYDGMPTPDVEHKSSITRRKARASRVSNNKSTAKQHVVDKPVKQQRVGLPSRPNAVKPKPVTLTKAVKPMVRNNLHKTRREHHDLEVEVFDRSGVLHTARTTFSDADERDITPDQTDLDDPRQFCVLHIDEPYYTDHVKGQFFGKDKYFIDYVMFAPSVLSIRPRFRNGSLIGLDFAVGNNTPDHVVTTNDRLFDNARNIPDAQKRLDSSNLPIRERFSVDSKLIANPNDTRFRRYDFEAPTNNGPVLNDDYVFILSYLAGFYTNLRGSLNHNDLSDLVINIYESLYRKQHPEPLAPARGDTPEEYERRD